MMKLGEVLTLCGWFSGWALLTGALAWCLGPLTWAISTGLACLGVAGIRPLAALLWHGAYWMSGEAKRESER